VVHLPTLDGSNDPNPLDDWNPIADHPWSSVVSSTGGLLGGFDSSFFNWDLSGFQNEINGTFSQVHDGLDFDRHCLTSAVLAGSDHGDGTNS
jgi:hypothetical protein